MFPADNFSVDITGADLHDSLAIAFANHKTVASFRVDEKDGVSPVCVLFYDVPEGATPFLAPLGVENASEVVKTWLRGVEPAKENYDFDGSTEKGWRVFTDKWWSKPGYRTGVCAIEPVWLYYGK